MRNIKLISCILLLAVISGAVLGCGSSTVSKTFVVGSDNYTEQFIVGEMLAILVEGNMPDVKVERKLGLNGVMVLHNAITSGEVDAAVEYTGSALMQMLQMDLITDPDEAYKVVKESYLDRWSIKWLEPLGFNNTYAMAVRKDYAEANGLSKSSDLAKVAENAVLGCSMQFSERPDGYPGWKEAYGIEFKDVVPMDSGLMYSSIKNNEVDVISAFSTDARIPEFDLVLLEDDKKFFPPYYAVPMVRTDTLEEIPGLEELINKLGGTLNDAKMAELNGKVDIDGMDPHDVAKEFLQEQGLI
ncbi:glycine betaine ABC transporter substrate-binding protein [Mahella australiensis]|uniref:Substrate-binding region of ABC-type glycine betaine transport system n=1 Tax=Mahella australiensis (strain DSM 15567 / CIP 107919 / 50-1 BON) TaxID=697281 RepID=F4A3A2_MAHA5|nr:glycine betaine ABC transporter substrate-binding protein [Mahella australiensis]AEE97357.1 Substrate-binding region of ABC-type glycine betaine transport system [Mahella australiensis 50-1 BON]